LPQASNRFKLVGLVAPRAGGSSKAGIALIAVDDKPARAFHVGASVDGRLVVQTVQKRSVSLGPRDAPAEVQLELPPPPPPATGTLPLPAPAAATTQKPGAAVPPVGSATQAPRGAVAPRNPPVDEQAGEPPANEAEPAPR
jgi:general secretion pathway protein C